MQLAADVYALRLAVQRLYGVLALVGKKDASWLEQERDALTALLRNEPVPIVGASAEASAQTASRAETLFIEMFAALHAQHGGRQGNAGT